MQVSVNSRRRTMNERAIIELEQMYMMLSEEKKKAIDEAIKALQAQADGDIITALCSLPKIQSEDGQDYVQLADVLETVRRYKPSVAIPSAESCEDEYIKVPKKALKYRTAGMVAYNAEWLKNHFDIERVVICGEQEPCEDANANQHTSNALNDVGQHANALEDYAESEE
jgi:hypothetical protein